MAFLRYSNNAIEMHNLDFNALFQDPATVTKVPTETLVLDPIEFTVGSTVFATAAHDLHLRTYLKVESGAGRIELLGSGFQFDAQGLPITGVIHWMVSPIFNGIDLTGMNLKVSDLMAVAQTATGDDDVRLMQNLMHGNDLVEASDKDDVLYTGGGKDLFNDFGGNDLVYGGRDDDFLQSGAGNDTIYGGKDNDILSNFAGDSHLYGGAGDDILQGGWDWDNMTGGTGQDSFLFQANSGLDVIQDFAHGEDRLVMLDFGTAMADLTIVQKGHDTMISFDDGWSVRLRNVDHTTLTAGNFVFGQPNFADTAKVAFFTGWDYIA